MLYLKRYFVLGFLLAAFVSLFAGCGRQQPKGDDFILLDDFDEAYASNRLGGTYGIVAEGGEAHFDFVQPPVPYLTHSAYLNVSYQFRQKGSAYAFLWMKLGKRGETYDYSDYLNLTGFNFLVFKYRSAKPVSLKVEIHEDRNGDKRFDIRQDHSSFVYTDSVKQFHMKDNWVKVLIPLKRYSGIKDWSKIIEMVLVFERERVGEAGQVQLDDIIFLRKDFKTTPSGNPSFFKSTEVRLNGRPPEGAQAMQNENVWTLQYEPGPDFQYLESLRLELKVGKTNQWEAVDSVFNFGQKSVDFLWDAATFSPPDELSFRVVGEDSFGRTQVLSGPFDGVNVPTLSDEQFLDIVQRKAFQYFAENQNLENGLFYDTTGGGDLSTGVSGFGLAALVIGVERGWMERKEGERRAKLCLQSSVHKVPGKEGLHYHFVRDNTLQRAGKSEVSTVDTALLIAGAITAGEYFGGDVKKLSDELYKRANWDFYLEKNPDEGHEMQFRHGWTPEDELVDSFWDYFTDETVLLDLIGISSPTYPVPAEVFYKFQRREGSYKGDKEPFIVSWHGSLFSYQYANAFYDFKNIVDRDGVNWFENSKKATLSNRNFVIDHSSAYRTYGEDLWGITSMRIPEGYVMHYGPLPNGQNKAEHDGTISPTGPAGSMPFAPYLTLRALKHMYAHYPQTWGIYGFKDSLNLDRNYTSPIYYGLGEGILLIGIENFRTGLVWNQFMKNEWVKQGLEKAGFKTAPEVSKPSADAAALEKEILQQAEAARLPNALSALQSHPLSYEAAAALVANIGKPYETSADPKVLVLMARLQIGLLDLLQANDLETGRKYIQFASELKTKAVGYLNRALKSNLTDFDRLEIYKRKLELLGKVQDYGELNQTRLELAKVLEEGMRKKVYNLPWVLKWLDGLEEKSAASVRQEFLKDLKDADRENLKELLQLRVRDAFEKKELRKAGESSEELIRFMEAPEERKELIGFLGRTAQAFSNVKKYTEAERFYRKIIDQYGDAADKEKYLPINATLLEAKGDKEKGFKEYQLFVDLYPQSPKVPEALTRMANIKSGLGDREKAIELFKQVDAEYGKTPYAQESVYLLGMLYFHANRYKDAVKTWESFLNRFPQSRYASIVKDYLERADAKQ